MAAPSRAPARLNVTDCHFRAAAFRMEEKRRSVWFGIGPKADNIIRIQIKKISHPLGDQSTRNDLK
jgi:hypothetical protein